MKLDIKQVNIPPVTSVILNSKEKVPSKQKYEKQVVRKAIEFPTIKK